MSSRKSGHMKKSRYFLGADNTELARLRVQHEAFLPTTMSLLKQAKVKKGECWMDLGCGPGFVSLELSKMVGPTGKVLGVDKEEKYLREAASTFRRKNNLSFRQIDLENPTFDKKDRFDGVFGRWITLFLANREKTLRLLANQLKAGGRMVFMEYVNFRSISLVPPEPSFDRFATAVQSAYSANGCDSSAGQFLLDIFQRLGLSITSLDVMVAAAKPGDDLWTWFEEFSFQFGPKFVEQGVLSESERQTYERDWKSFAGRKTGFLLTPPLLKIIATKKK